ncbi:MAG: hypothetical protein ABJP70_03360 [Erythrobacter sp.]
MKNFGLLALPVLAVALAPSAQACSIAPPPQPPEPEEGESSASHSARVAAFHFGQLREKELDAAREQAQREGYERALWQTASVVALVEVVATVEPPEDVDFNFKPGVVLKVVQAERGSPQSEPFTITFRSLTSCGPFGHVRMAQGDISERFVVFAKDDKLDMESVIIGYTKAEAQIYGTTQLFEK